MNPVLAVINGAISTLRPGVKPGSPSLDPDLLAEIGRTVTSPFSGPGVLERFASLVNEVVRCDRIAISVVDYQAGTFTLVHVLGAEVSDFAQGDVIPLGNSFVSEVITSEHPIRFSGSAQNSQKIGFVISGIRSRIGTSLRSNEQVIGSFHIASLEPNAYSDLDLARLEQIGHQISGSVASEFLLETERVRASQLKSMFQVTEILASAQTFEEKSQAIVKILVRISGADHAILRRADICGDRFNRVATEGSGPLTFEPTLNISEKDSATSIAIRNGRTLVVNDYQRFSDAMPVMQNQGVASAIVIPIMSSGEALGLLSLTSKTENHFNDQLVALLSAVADGIVPLFESAGLSESLRASQEELALVDQISRVLTSTLNIQDVYESFATELKELVDFDRVTISAIDHETQTLTVKYTSGTVVETREAGASIPFDQSEAI